ncbi:hypothetical protein PFISCL1PPCAC_5186, partial [Pristionchus fissidentatus]
LNDCHMFSCSSPPKRAPRSVDLCLIPNTFIKVFASQAMEHCLRMRMAWNATFSLLSTFFLVFLPFYTKRTPSPFELHCNVSTHFSCHDAIIPCIPLEWICDNHPDCANGLDEAGCVTLYKCAVGQLTCRNGQCIDAKLRCDKQIDCKDGSDEKGCDEMEQIAKNSGLPTPYFHPRKCAGIGFHACLNGVCIPGRWKCDGTADCEDGSDEENCGFKHYANRLLSFFFRFVNPEVS